MTKRRRRVKTNTRLDARPSLQEAIESAAGGMGVAVVRRVQRARSTGRTIEDQARARRRREAQDRERERRRAARLRTRLRTRGR